MTRRGARFEGRSALVVDDSEDQGDLLRVHLERLGFTVSVVGTAEVAMRSYRADAPEVAVVDLLLPGIDGWQLVAAMKSEVPDSRLVVTSVLGVEDYPSVDAILPKPFTFKQIAHTMDTIFPNG
ncbi:response regulator [Herbiconiux sp. YIM B11900]|uniref:response regulator n=1 Tax=Herbiconiux sp. YIM B11900 TaxID=3404131 RepID=UPI003F84E68B